MFIKKLIKALIFVGISVTIGVSFCAIFAAILKDEFKFISGWCYFIGAFSSVTVCVFLRRHVKDKSCFNQKDLISGNGYWVERINSKNFLSRRKAYLMLVPYLCLGLAIFALIIIFYDRLQSGGTRNYVGYAALCAMLSSVATALVIYSIMSIRALDVCEECGSVNAFISDDCSVHISTVAYWHTKSGEALHPARGMDIYRRKVESNGDRILCHCAKCNHNKMLTQIYDADWHWL